MAYAGLEADEDGAAAFEREAVQRKQCADGPEACVGLLGNEWDGDPRVLTWKNACGLDALPEAAEGGEPVVAE
jgi:hypothetical protein